jgi:energy-coupling factor transport system permease protein
LLPASFILSRLQGPGETRTAPPLPTGLALAVCFSLSLLAIVLRNPPHLAALTLADAMFCTICRLPGKAVRRALRLFVWQSALLVSLHLLRFGWEEGLWPGARSSWQLFLAFLPGVAMLHGTSQAALVRTLTRLMPHRTAFALAMSLKFVPLLLVEIRVIYEAQVLRGARILPRDLLRLRNWPDLLHCLIAPAVVQAMVLAGNIADAARAREFGRHARRTCWPGSG